jgi:amino acid transporter
MAPTDLSREQQIQQDVTDLHRLGYAQQLFREMGGFSNFAISFSIISILTGAVLLYGYGLKFAGPIINTVGWPLISVLTLCVAASMAELASAYPTAGGLYFWAYRLGGRGRAWTTAWLNMIGQITITAGINVAASIYIIGAITRIFNVPADAAVPVFGSTTSWYFQIFVMVLIMIPQVLINIQGIRLTARLNDFSVYWHIIGVAVIVALLIFLGQHHNSLGFMFSSSTSVNPLDASSADLGKGVAEPALVFGNFKFASPLFALAPGLTDLYRAAPFLLCFLLATLQAQWTYTGYDASAHVAEETVMARLNSAWGVFLSVAVSAVVGYIVLLALTWSIPEGKVGETAADAYPVLYIVYNNLSTFFANVVAVIIGVAMWLCGLASITSMGRMWYAFARDDGMPGSGLIKQVSPIVITSVLAVLICIYAAAFFVVTSISTITLYLAYMFPIYLNWRNKRRRQGEFTTPETAPWSMGKWGPLVNVIAIVWVVIISVIFSLPPNELVLWTMLGLAVVLTLYWQLSAKRSFVGPSKTDEAALRKLEAAFAPGAAS